METAREEGGSRKLFPNVAGSKRAARFAKVLARTLRKSREGRFFPHLSQSKRGVGRDSNKKNE